MPRPDGQPTFSEWLAQRGTPPNTLTVSERNALFPAWQRAVGVPASSDGESAFGISLTNPFDTVESPLTLFDTDRWGAKYTGPTLDALTNALNVTRTTAKVILFGGVAIGTLWLFRLVRG
jgi:hypothetical protein